MCGGVSNTFKNTFNDQLMHLQSSKATMMSSEEYLLYGQCSLQGGSMSVVDGCLASVLPLR